jgi:hypothetical protein
MKIKSLFQLTIAAISFITMENTAIAQTKTMAALARKPPKNGCTATNGKMV